MKNTTKNLVSILLMVSLITACGDDSDPQVRSDSVATGQMFATFQVISDGEDYVYAEAQLTRNVPPLNVSNSTDFIHLVDNDELWLSAGPDIEAIAIEDNIFGAFRDLENTQAEFQQSYSQRESYDFLFSRVIINELGTWYSARLPQSAEREYRVALFRHQDTGTPARDSVVTLPPPYNVTSPISGSQLSRSTDDIDITWNDIDPLSSVEVETVTTCANNNVETFATTELSDDGAITIAAGELTADTLTGTCSTTINIRKIRIGQFDARFIGGTVNGYQIRRMVIVTTP